MYGEESLVEFTAQCPRCDKTYTHADYPCENCGKDVLKLAWNSYERLSESLDGRASRYRYQCPNCENWDYDLYCKDEDCHPEGTRRPTAIDKKFVKVAGSGKGCFIATAMFGYDSQPTIMLRRFRDKVLLKCEAGRKFTYWYYKTSPKFLRWLGIEPEYE